jgi:prepilin peptidase CpaA
MIAAAELGIGTARPLSVRNIAWISAFGLPIAAGPIWASFCGDGWGFAGSVMGSQLLLLLAVTTITDIRSRKIYNYSTYPAILIAFAANCWASVTHSVPIFLGTVGAGSSLTGAAACFFVVFLAYQMTGCGAGDVKMATAIGAILGLHVGLTAVGYSYIVAAFAAVGSTLWAIGPLRFLRACGLAILDAVSPGKHQNSHPEDRQRFKSTIPMAPFFAIGTLLALLEAM